MSSCAVDIVTEMLVTANVSNSNLEVESIKISDFLDYSNKLEKLIKNRYGVKEDLFELPQVEGNKYKLKFNETAIINLDDSKRFQDDIRNKEMKKVENAALQVVDSQNINPPNPTYTSKPDNSIFPMGENQFQYEIEVYPTYEDAYAAKKDRWVEYENSVSCYKI